MTTTELVALARSAVAGIERAGGQARVLGGIGVELTAGERPASLRREIEDVDVVCRRADRRAAEAALAGLGLVPDAEVNALHGARRQVWWLRDDPAHLDLFLGDFVMCHTLRFDDRLAAPGPALPLGDLLLSKLQVVELTDKDVRDLGVLLGCPDPGDAVERVADACAGDWGLATTVSDNLEAIGALVAGHDAQLGAIASARALTLREAIDAAPKGRRWRMRARVGRSLRWYELPDEVVEEG